MIFDSTYPLTYPPTLGGFLTPLPYLHVELSDNFNVLGRTRTCGLLLRRQPLYPPELRGLNLSNQLNSSKLSAQCLPALSKPIWTWGRSGAAVRYGAPSIVPRTD